MTEQEKIQILIKKINDTDAIVVGTASGMSAAGGLRFSLMRRYFTIQADRMNISTPVLVQERRFITTSFCRVNRGISFHPESVYLMRAHRIVKETMPAELLDKIDQTVKEMMRQYEK